MDPDRSAPLWAPAPRGGVGGGGVAGGEAGGEEEGSLFGGPWAVGPCGLYAPAAWGVRSVQRYELLEAIGEGTYGKVYRARDRFDGGGKLVALKQMLRHHEDDGFPKTETREIKILRRLHHPNMVNLLEVVSSLGAEGYAKAEAKSHHGDGGTMGALLGVGDRVGDVFMVFDYVDYDLAGLMDSGYTFSVAQVKSYVYQLCRVLVHLHGQGFVHRDIKPSNLLLTDDNVLKLGDFGLARSLRQNDGTGRFTTTVITLWYRPPELLCGVTEYDGAVDMWSVGCILVELLVGRPIFAAKSEADTLRKMAHLLGTPATGSMIRSLPLYDGFNLSERASGLKDFLSRFPQAQDPELLHLVTRLLEWDPRLRITAREVLQSRWFAAAPRIDRDMPHRGLVPLRESPGFVKGVDHHEFAAKQRRRGVEAAATSGGAVPVTSGKAAGSSSSGGDGGGAPAPPPAWVGAAPEAALSDAVSWVATTFRVPYGMVMEAVRTTPADRDAAMVVSEATATAVDDALRAPAACTTTAVSALRHLLALYQKMSTGMASLQSHLTTEAPSEKATVEQLLGNQFLRHQAELVSRAVHILIVGKADLPPQALASVTAPPPPPTPSPTAMPTTTATASHALLDKGASESATSTTSSMASAGGGSGGSRQADTERDRAAPPRPMAAPVMAPPPMTGGGAGGHDGDRWQSRPAPYEEHHRGGGGDRMAPPRIDDGGRYQPRHAPPMPAAAHDKARSPPRYRREEADVGRDGAMARDHERGREWDRHEPRGEYDRGRAQAPGRHGGRDGYDRSRDRDWEHGARGREGVDAGGGRDWGWDDGRDHGGGRDDWRGGSHRGHGGHGGREHGGEGWRAAPPPPPHAGSDRYRDVDGRRGYDDRGHRRSRSPPPSRGGGGWDRGGYDGPRRR